MSNLDDDFVKIGLIGAIALIGFVILLAIIFYKANVIVNAAYDASDPIVRAVK